MRLSSVPLKHANGSSFVVAVPCRAARFAAKCVCSSPCPRLHTVIQSRVGHELYQGGYVRCVVPLCAWVWITLLMHGCTLLDACMLYAEGKCCVQFSRDAHGVCACVCMHACNEYILYPTAILYLCIILGDILKATEGEEMELPGMEICEHFLCSW